MLEINKIDMGITPLLYMAAHKCNLIHNEILKVFSISVQQAAVLAIIKFIGNGTINQKTISDKMGIKESSASSIVKTMIKNGFIIKEQSKTDARSQLLIITPKGNEICEAIKNTADEVERELYGHLTKDERSTLIRLLKKLA